MLCILKQQFATAEMLTFLRRAHDADAVLTVVPLNILSDSSHSLSAAELSIMAHEQCECHDSSVT